MRRFKKCYIEITNACNLKCSFCPSTKRNPEFMSIETFNRILEQIKPHTEYIYFHVKGEPLLHPEIDKFLDLSFEKGFKVNITTNGTLIGRVKDKLISKPALRQVNFSLHSFYGNEGYDKEEYMKQILLFTREARERSEVIISFRLWNLEHEGAVDSEKKRNHELIEIIEKEFGLDGQLEEADIGVRGIKIAEKVYLNQDYAFKWPDLNEEEDDGAGFCLGLRDQVAILVDGTVVPCCLDGEGIINLGNVNKDDFLDIIQSERSKSIYDGFSIRYAVEELCRKCGYRKRFGGLN